MEKKKGGKHLITAVYQDGVRTSPSPAVPQTCAPHSGVTDKSLTSPVSLPPTPGFHAALNLLKQKPQMCFVSGNFSSVFRDLTEHQEIFLFACEACVYLLGVYVTQS